MKQNVINKLCSLKEVIGMINEKRVLLLAGNETVLKQLPEGNWIGGTIPYFMDIEGGRFTKNEIFVTDLTTVQQTFLINCYGLNDIDKIFSERYGNGFTCLLIPGFSDMHQKYSMAAESISGLYDVPVAGWITGIDLNELGTAKPKVFNGLTKEEHDNCALALHVELSQGRMAHLEILNIFKQGEGDEIVFSEDGFGCTMCEINGNKVNLAQYVIENKIDTRLPLVADYSGASINISFQEVNEDKKEVKFYAPVRKGVRYKMAAPVADYISEFMQIVPDETSSADIVMSCNCILNYLYSELEKKKTGGMTGPITFGEIAYVLVNQTMVYLSVI
jgi:hypothetical protein